MPHTYAIDAANLVEECFDQLGQQLEILKYHHQHQHHYERQAPIVSCLHELEHVLLDSYDYLYEFMTYLIQEEKENYDYNEDCNSTTSVSFLNLSSVSNNDDNNNTNNNDNSNNNKITTLLEMVTILKEIMRQHQQKQQQQPNRNQNQYYRGGYTTVRHRPLPLNNTFYSSNHPHGNATVESLLFRLTVILQLCLLRMNDARRVICSTYGTAVVASNDVATTDSSTRQQHIVDRNEDEMHNGTPQRQQQQQRQRFAVLFGLSVVTTYNLPIRLNPIFLSSLFAPIISSSSSSSSRSHSVSVSQCNNNLVTSMTAALTQVGVTTLALYYLQQKWRTAWMINKLSHSTDDIRNWNQQWKVFVHDNTSDNGNNINTIQQHHQQSYRQSNNHGNRYSPIQIRSTNNNGSNIEDNDSLRTQLLINHAMQTTSKTSFWHSQGEIRFLMMKHAMDVVYASVGTAVSLTGGTDGSVSTLSTTMATAAAASLYYSVTGGASQRANEVISSSSQSARDILQNAWGMMSLSGLKRLSLQASRLLKGAAVADRIDIAGVPCFVLSADPSPELAAAIVQSRKLQLSHSSSNQLIPRLSTIDEERDHDENDDEETLTSSSQSSRKPFARCHESYRQRDVILHLTGGGFFAHIIASDLPYLLDWSAATGAVVICPEYALLPEHTYPVALEQIERVYRTLIGDRSSVPNAPSDTNMPSPHILGFETNQIIITGESTGGNLAAALCVKIGMQKSKNKPIDIPSPDVSPPLQSILDTIRSTDKVFGDSKDIDTRFNQQDHPITYEETVPPTPPAAIPNGRRRAATQSRQCRMPDALMLSCPVLNLSLEMSHSRALAGNNDPILSSGLISAISDAYLPTEKLGISKDYPLASPIYATDDILHEFPTTLLFASSTDPMLDDAVIFNQRLRYVGVPSELYAARNLPHAYLGLGTAGFPEAKQVQERCIRWLNQQLGSGCH